MDLIEEQPEGGQGLPRRPRSMALALADELAARIRDGRLVAGLKLPTEAGLMAEHGVSRTVVREALSQLQAAGLVRTRHGIGTFVLGPPTEEVFRVDRQQLETLREVIALLELRISVETEAAALAAQRRTGEDLRAMRSALDDFARALDEGRDAVEADFRFHAGVARATHNPHFVALLSTMGPRIIPRARLHREVPDLPAGPAGTGAAGQRPAQPARAEGVDAVMAVEAARLAYLRRVHAEHESIHDAIAAGDAEAARAAMRTHLVNSRERRRRAAAQAQDDASGPLPPSASGLSSPEIQAAHAPASP
jgi:DNA-binding FadR family transcriptional regulator